MRVLQYTHTTGRPDNSTLREATQATVRGATDQSATKRVEHFENDALCRGGLVCSSYVITTVINSSSSPTSSLLVDPGKNFVVGGGYTFWARVATSDVFDT